MTDRELLKLAAKAAGIEYGTKRSAPLSPSLYLGPIGGWWNPLDDDGAALRLAVRCSQLFGFFRFMRVWLVCMSDEAGSPSDPSTATRRAIVRAAAAIGETMP